MKQACFDSRHCSTLVELLRQRAAHEPDRLAYTFLVDGDRAEVRMTHADLDRKARAIAAHLQTRCAAGDRALLLYPPGLEYIAAFFGCLYAGVIAVPAFPPRPNRPMPRLQGIVADAQVKVALSSTAVLDNIEQRFSHAPELRDLYWYDTEQLSDEVGSAWTAPEISRDSLAFLQYTSGSTSVPKGVMLSHGNLLHNLELVRQSFETTRDTHSVFWLPPYHDMGLIGGILEPLYAGAPTTLMAPVAFLQCPFRWLDAISRTRAVISGAPNFAYDLCVDKITPEQRARLDLSSWTLAFNGAEPVRPETLERFSRAFEPCGFRREAFYPCYGLAEATLFVTGGRKAAPPMVRSVAAADLEHNRVTPSSSEGARTLVGSGQCSPEQHLLIVHRDMGVPCEPGQVGEIWVRGPSVARGYWNRPDESARTFGAQPAGSTDGPFLRTGDLGFLLDGELFVTGRAKDLIILRGKNHYPQDIERTVEASCPAIRPSCVAAFAAEVDGEERLIVVAEIERAVRKQNLDDTLGAVRRAIAAEHDIAVWAVVLIKTLSIPKTSSGKIQRHLCRERFLNKTLDIVAAWNKETPSFSREPQASAAPMQPASGRAGEITNWLIAQIAERLQMPAAAIDAHMPFATLGMDSMTAVLLAGDLETWLGRALPPTLMYDFPSIAELARHLSEEPMSEAAPELVPAKRIDRQLAQTLLARLDELSGEEASLLLKELQAEEAFATGTA